MNEKSNYLWVPYVKHKKLASIKKFIDKTSCHESHCLRSDVVDIVGRPARSRANSGQSAHSASGGCIVK